MTTVRPMRRMRQMLADRTITAGARLAGGLPDWLLGAAARDIAGIANLALRPILRGNLRGALGPDPRLRQIERDYRYRAAQWARYTALNVPSRICRFRLRRGMRCVTRNVLTP